MVNEEDHLRLQAILPGLQIDAAYKIADQMDDQFGSQLEYAFDAHYGYLTSSLSNCGTGLRVSVMAHLPGLALSGKISSAMEAARTLGAAVRGPYGEGSAVAGDVYQISNAVSTGKSERQLLTRLAATATLLLTDEQAARELLWREKRSVIEDNVGGRAGPAEDGGTSFCCGFYGNTQHFAAGRTAWPADRRDQSHLQ